MINREMQIKHYICTHFCEETPETEKPLSCGFKEMWVPQNVAKTLYFLAKMIRPKRVLEIGTLAGYSALWLARALDETGKLVTIESDKRRHKQAVSNFSFSQKADQIEAICGDAVQIMRKMIDQNEEPFDLIFIDADKGQYCDYLEPAIQLTRSGGVILADNLIPKRGKVGAPDGRDYEAVEVYAFNQMIASDPRLESHIMTTLALDGRVDGLGVALVK